MARYVDSALSAGEPILYDAKVHWAIFITPFIQLGVYALIFGAIAMFVGFGTITSIAQEFSDISIFGWLSSLSGFVMPLLFFMVIVGFSLIHSIIYYFNSDFILTDRRVMSKFGLLSRTTSEQRLSKVESIHVYQSLLGRLLNFGNVTITGTGSSTTTFGPMADPIECKRAIEAQLDKLKDSPADR